MYTRMSTLALVALVTLATVLGISADDVTDGTELVLAFLVHRHGDRTPVESSIAYSTDPDEVELRTRQYGYGQLTDAGRRTGYKVGEHVRQRYGHLLASQYNRSELYVRCTDSTRTKMTALTSLAALYPPGPDPSDNWSETLPWQPVPYTTMPVKYDSNLAMLNCPTFISSYMSAATSSSDELTAYSSVLERWTALSGYNISQAPVLAYSIYDVYTSQMGLGVPLGEELEELLPEIEQVAGVAIRLVFGNEDSISLQAGVLLNEFFEVSALAMAGEETQRVRILSAHDYNVFSLMSVARLLPTAVPKYGSVITLELRRVLTTGKYVVLPVYLASPADDSVEYMQVSGCDELLCDFDTFSELTSSYVLDESEWRSACAFTDDLEIDDSSIA